MNTRVLQKPKTGKKLIFFVLFLVLLFAAFAALWYWAAGKLDDGARNLRTNLSENGTVLDCKNQEVRGFPFRLGIFCSSLLYADPVRAINVKGGAIRSAAQVYNPGHVITELDSPVEVSIPGLAPLALDWQSLSGSTNISSNGLKRASVSITDFKIAANDLGIKSPLASIETMQMHARPTPQSETGKSLDVAVSAKDWKIADGGTNTIEPVDFNLDLSLDNAMEMIADGRDAMEMLRVQGGEGEIHDFRITTQTGGEFALSGPVRISPEGILSGELLVSIIDPQTLASYAGKVFPPARTAIENIMPYLEGLGSVDGGKLEIRDLKLAVRDGEVMLGFFSIGRIPKLF